MQKTVKDAGKAEQSSLTSASASAQRHWLRWLWRQRKAGGGGGGSLHNYYLLSSSQRINFQTITYFPTHADTHTSLIWRGFIS